MCYIIIINHILPFSGCTFAKFGAECGGRKNIALMASAKIDDNQHPVRLSNTKVVDVDNLIYLNEPNVG